MKQSKIAFQCLSTAKTAGACPLAKGNASPLDSPFPAFTSLLKLHFSMRKILIFQTRQRVRRLLDRKRGKANLQKLKRARYMREQYLAKKKRLNLLFEQADFQEIQTHAQTSGLTPTAFLRSLVLAYLKDERVPSKQAEHSVSELIFLLRNIGNNINQIARHSNTLQKLTLGDFAALKILLNHLEDVAEQGIKKLL